MATCITARIRHPLILASLALLAAALAACHTPSKEPAAFSVSNLEVQPKLPLTGELFSISFTLSNSGGSRGEYEAVLHIVGYISLLEENPGSARSYSQTVSLDAGRSKTVTFESLSISADGIYKARVEDQLKVFEVGC